MNVKRLTNLGLILLFLTLLPLTKVLAEGLAPPQIAVESASSQLQKKLQEKDFTKDFTQITGVVKEIIYPHMDFDRISALVLGKLWKAASLDERERFKQEFQTLLIRTYARAFVEFKEWTVRFLPLEMEAGSNKAIVKTQVLQPGKQPIAIDYRMMANGGDWKAYDILIEGVSLVTNYRTTLSSEVQSKGSLDAVIDSLAKRNAEALVLKSSDKS